TFAGTHDVADMHDIRGGAPTPPRSARLAGARVMLFLITMHGTLEPTAPPSHPPSPNTTTFDGTRTSELGDLLMDAAQAAVGGGMELDAFMTLAWTAYVEAQPGLREQLEQQQLTAMLAEERRRGRVGQA